MSKLKDIENRADIELLVNTFYEQVAKNEWLAPIFESKINGDWQPHLEKMYGFWHTILLNEHLYSGSPFKHHANLPIDAKHFEEWLKLFYQTVDSLFAGEKAEEAKMRATKMGEMFQYKLQYMKDNPRSKYL